MLPLRICIVMLSTGRPTLGGEGGCDALRELHPVPPSPHSALRGRCKYLWRKEVAQSYG